MPIPLSPARTAVDGGVLRETWCLFLARNFRWQSLTPKITSFIRTRPYIPEANYLKMDEWRGCTPHLPTLFIPNAVSSKMISRNNYTALTEHVRAIKKMPWRWHCQTPLFIETREGPGGDLGIRIVSRHGLATASPSNRKYLLPACSAQPHPEISPRVHVGALPPANPRDRSRWIIFACLKFMECRTGINTVQLVQYTSRVRWISIGPFCAGSLNK